MVEGIFSKMAAFNKAALSFLIIAKFFGLIGVAMGFLQDYHRFGGYFLGAAFCAITISITCAVIQTSRDKQIFSNEDEERRRINSIVEMKKKLENEIRSLEDKRNALMGLEIRRGRI